MKHDSIDEDGNLCLIDRVDDECLVHMLQAATKCRPQEVRRSRSTPLKAANPGVCSQVAKLWQKSVSYKMWHESGLFHDSTNPRDKSSSIHHVAGTLQPLSDLLLTAACVL